jgi:uncharacterized RDD family membrane protein YckC
VGTTTLRLLPDPTGEPNEEGLLGLALAASALMSSLAAPVLRRGDDGAAFPQHMFNRVVEQVVPTVVDSVDIDALLERVDVDALLRRIDVDGLLDRIDIDRLLSRVDVQALISRVDVGGLIERVDLNAVLAEVDIDALLERIDVAAIAERAQVGELVAQSTRDVAGTTLDLARRQLVALDLLVLRVVHRLMRRTDWPLGPASLVTEEPAAEDAPVPERAGHVTGRFAGPGTRLVEFIIDITLIVSLFGVTANVLLFCARVILGVDVSTTNTDNIWWLIAYLGWAFTYFFVSLAITGRTIGKWLVGVRVVQRDGTPLRTGSACLRVLALPVALLSLGIGLIGIVIGKERRALQDVVARSVVVYDWGDRPAEMPAPLTRWLNRQGTLELPLPATVVVPHEVAGEALADPASPADDPSVASADEAQPPRTP